MPKSKPKAIVYGPICAPAHGYKNARWVENVSHGLRLVGFADDIAKHIRHTGWFTDEDLCEKFRGVVYQLPTRNGRDPIYAYGYADPNNEDCAFLCFDREVSDKVDAAHAADRFAEIFAEGERDYREAWSAGRRCEDIAENIGRVRREALALGEELRKARRERIHAPKICATIRERIASLYAAIQKLRRERDQLIEDFGQRPGFVE